MATFRAASMARGAVPVLTKEASSAWAASWTWWILSGIVCQWRRRSYRAWTGFGKGGLGDGGGFAEREFAESETGVSVGSTLSEVGAHEMIVSVATAGDPQYG